MTSLTTYAHNTIKMFMLNVLKCREHLNEEISFPEKMF